MGMKDEDLAGLSDEERAALMDDDNESEILGKIAGNDDDSEEDDDDEGGQSNEDSAGNDDDKTSVDDGEKKAGSADDAAGEADAAPVTAVAAEFHPELKADLPEGMAEKISSLDARTTELLDKFKSGEIELPEFMSKKGDIDNERLQLTLAAEQAKWASSQNEDARAQRWKWEQERFFVQEKSSIYKDPIILAALNASVKQLSADAANASKPAAFFLEEADRQVRKRFAMGGNEKQQTTDTKKVRDPDLSNLPKTLANLPAADISETNADEFSYLEKLEGIELEQALRKLTPDQEARYLGAA